jgi:hypothetical protein
MHHVPLPCLFIMYSIILFIIATKQCIKN